MIQTRFFEEENIQALEKEVNEFLSTLKKVNFIDLKHGAVGASAEGSALKLYTAIVVYEMREEKDRKARAIYLNS